MLMESNAKFVVHGKAKDQEKIIELRPQIEDQARIEYGEFISTKLYWRMAEDGSFDYEIHFFDEDTE